MAFSQHDMRVRGMPHQEQKDHKYWCPGPWPWEWFDTCTRTELEWCYDFSWVEETDYGFLAYLKGCEAGTLYTWYAFGLGFGTSNYGPGEMCFLSPLNASDKCAAEAMLVANLEATAGAPRPQKLARNRIRVPQHHHHATELGGKPDPTTEHQEP